VAGNVPGNSNNDNPPATEAALTRGSGLLAGEITELKIKWGICTATAFRSCCPKGMAENETHPCRLYIFVTVEECPGTEYALRNSLERGGGTR
jgi:hypothetical protein